MFSGKTSFWQVFRLIFVVFFLYLMGDAFYRWDGFRYHSTFSEFLPGVALVTVLLGIAAVFTALLLWLSAMVLEWVWLKIRTDHLLVFTGVFVLLGVAVWKGKKLLWPNVQTTFELKFIVFFCVTVVGITLTWLSRNKAEPWIGVIQERITPLVWLFVFMAGISIPLVAYHTWGKEADNVVSQKLTQPSGTGKNRPNIILLTFDTLTARDMSVYGYDRPTTPFISEWAESASIFTRLEAESNWTSSTTASLMTGKRVWTHRRFQPHSYNPVKSDIESLPLVLKDNGYYNMAFVVNRTASVKANGVSNAFDIISQQVEFRAPMSLYEIIDKFLEQIFLDKIQLHNWFLKKNFIIGVLISKISKDVFKTEYPPEKAFNEFLAVIDDNPPEPYFAWIHLFPPHAPFLPPEPYMGMFDSSSEIRTKKTHLEKMQKMPPDYDTFRARYDEFIRYCDKQFEGFIAELTGRNNVRNAVIILSADHGESFEHDYFTHGGPHLYEQVTHIPLIIKEPGRSGGKVINDVVEQIDIPAAILDLADIPMPSWMEGRSLVPLLRGEQLPSMPAFAMNFEKNPSRGQQITKGTIAVWEGDYKLIHYLENRKSLLFNLKEDADELNDLFDKEQEVGKHLISLIYDKLKEANERISRGE